MMFSSSYNTYKMENKPFHRFKDFYWIPLIGMILFFIDDKKYDFWEAVKDPDYGVHPITFITNLHDIAIILWSAMHYFTVGFIGAIGINYLVSLYL